MRITWILAILALLGACAGDKSDEATTPAASIQGTSNEAFLAMTEEIAVQELRRNPLLATSFGVSVEYVGEKYNDKLGSYSVAEVERSKDLAREYLERIQQFDRVELTGTAATTYDVLVDTLGTSLSFTPYVHGAFGTLGVFTPYPISQISGSHIGIPQALQTQHPLRGGEDANDYVSRLEAFPGILKGMADVVLEDAKRGVLPPRFALEGAISTLEKLIPADPAKHPLVSSFNERLAKVSSINEGARAKLVDQAAEIVAKKISPELGHLATTLRELLPRASEHAGVWALPEGATRYRLALENFGAAGKTPEQVHQLGLSEVARLQSEMDSILRAQGYSEGSVIERYIALSGDKQFLYPDTPEGKKKLLGDLNTQVAEVTRRLSDVFATLPKADVEVRAIPEHEQDTSSGGYYTGPSLDGSRPGIYWINLKSTKDWPKFSLPTLTYHEANPGHHLQNTIAREIRDMPMIRKMVWYSQYGEGWALYAERLAKELGLYEGNPLGDLGRLQSELFRAARLVVDTGLHHKRWTREKAIEYMRGATGDTVASITREVERYSVWPGQACSYKLGQLRILELREDASKRLGSAFDLREFHDTLLVHGAVPLSVLEKNVEAWIVSKSKAP